MAKYNHAYTIAFSLESEHPTGNDVTGEIFREALQKRMADLDKEGNLYWDEAVGMPYDTYEVEDE